MHKATANGDDNKCMNIYEVLKAVGFGNHPVHWTQEYDQEEGLYTKIN